MDCRSYPSRGFGPATASQGRDRGVKVRVVLDSSLESSRWCSATVPHAVASSRSRSTSRIGGSPKCRYYAINKDGIIQKIFHGYAVGNASPVWTVSYGYAPQEPYAYDPERARAILAEAGCRR